jgi:hypothetical protein
MDKPRIPFIWTTHSYYEYSLAEVDPIEGVEPEQMIMADGMIYSKSRLKELLNDEKLNELAKSNQVIIDNLLKKRS